MTPFLEPFPDIDGRRGVVLHQVLRDIEANPTSADHRHAVPDFRPTGEHVDVGQNLGVILPLDPRIPRRYPGREDHLSS